jgi:hypothetical protein
MKTTTTNNESAARDAGLKFRITGPAGTTRWMHGDKPSDVGYDLLTRYNTLARRKHLPEIMHYPGRCCGDSYDPSTRDCHAVRGSQVVTMECSK